MERIRNMKNLLLKIYYAGGTWEQAHKRGLKIILVVQVAILAAIWIFAYLVKYHHIWGFYWKGK